MEFEAAKRRRDDELDRDVIHAWRLVHIYVKTKADKKMPTLSKLLTKRAERRRTPRQTAIEQRLALQVLSAQYGIPLRKAVH